MGETQGDPCKRRPRTDLVLMPTPEPSLSLRPPPSALDAARDAAAACDLSPLAVVSISGPDAATFLQGQLSNDVTEASVDRAQYTSFNSPKGRMLANFALWRESADEFRALLPRDLAGPVTARLRMFVLRSKVALADVSDASVRFGIGGPRATEAMRETFGSAPEAFSVSRHDDLAILALPGPRYVAFAAPAIAASVGARLAHAAVEAPFAVWQWLTIRAGIPVVTSAVQDQLIAQSANWDLLGGINFRKGCYTGQEIIARMQYLGRQKERLFAFRAAASVVAGARLFGSVFGDQPCGVVVNAAPAPGSGTDLLAVVPFAAIAEGGLHVGAPDGPVLIALPLPYAVPPPEPARVAGGHLK